MQYKIRAQTLAGYSPYSIRNTFVPASVPTVAVGPVKEEADETSIVISWVAADDGGSPIVGYKVY